tara:strand:+ start:30147 stop:30734 length:588 start_codon:yes stop_codon:yes gene_type:complete
MPCKSYVTRFLCVSLLLLSSLAQADVCVWRDPERTMVRLFPEAKDYKTEIYKLNSDQVARIEALVGEPLHSSEKEEYNIYAITADGRTLGWVLALAGTGEYGVIETVVGLNADHSIRGVYLQRVRERKRKALKSDNFLGQFRGKTQKDTLAIKPIADAEKASNEITRLVNKMLAYEAVLNTGSKSNPNTLPTKGE